MPIFDFESPAGEIISLHLDLKQPAAAYRVQVVEGVTYKRVYTAPLAAKDTQTRDATLDDYNRITADKNLTVGEMTKVSRDMAAKRAEREGIEAVRQKAYDSYEQRIGKPHKDKLREEKLKRARASLKKFGVTVDMDKS